jgi:hypothetical protein
MIAVPETEQEMTCFIYAKEYVRINMGLSSNKIPDHKILRFCKQKDNDVKETKIFLKKHAKYMKKVDLKRVAQIPLSKYNFSRLENIFN